MIIYHEKCRPEAIIVYEVKINRTHIGNIWQNSLENGGEFYYKGVENNICHIVTPQTFYKELWQIMTYLDLKARAYGLN